METCRVDGCEDEIFRKKHQLCSKHYQRWQAHGDPLGGGRYRGVGDVYCAVPDCGARRRKRDWCDVHYQRWINYGDPAAPVPERKILPCSVDVCGRDSIARGYCSGHYAKWRKHGDPLFVSTAATRRKGKRIRRPEGYIHLYEPEHPNARKDGKLAEHVKVMSKVLGRPLVKGENVHHRNGVRDDNRPENLELWRVSQPCGQRVSDLIRYANDLIGLYGSDPEPYE